MAVYTIRCLTPLFLLFLVANNGGHYISEEIIGSDDSIMGRRNSRVRRATSENKLIITQDERIGFIYWHNFFRGNVTPPSADMSTMFWNSDLEIGAQLYAQKCYWAHGQVPMMSTRWPLGLGQNLYAGSGYPSALGVLRSWYDEYTNYDFDKNSCAAEQMCGHYTQVVWSYSYLVGCGIAFCPVLGNTQYKNMWMVACNYYNSGNRVGGMPYEAGRACSDCSSSMMACSKTFPNLCAPTVPCKTVSECQVTDQTNCLCDESFYYSAVARSQNLTTTTTIRGGTTTSKTKTTPKVNRFTPPNEMLTDSSVTTLPGAILTLNASAISSTTRHRDETPTLPGTSSPHTPDPTAHATRSHNAVTGNGFAPRHLATVLEIIHIFILLLILGS